MELLHVYSLEEARALLSERAAAAPFGVERLGLAEAAGRVLAEDVTAAADIPAFARSTVDGYALRSADTHGCTESIPAFLDILEEIQIGRPAAHRVTPGTCAYVPTGGMLPEGADAVVMVEYCENLDERTVSVGAPAAAGENVIRAGEDIQAGRPLLPRGTRLGAAQIGALAAAGAAEVSVIKPPRVWVLSTGDELARPGQPLKPGQVYDINTRAVAAAAEKLGFAVTCTRALPDSYEEIRGAVREGMANADIVILSGGSSKGKKDMTGQILDELASPGVFVHGLAVKPGKPTILAWDKPSRTILAGLPGHPAAALMVFQQIFGWYWRQRAGERERPAAYAALETNLPGAGGKTTFYLVELLEGPEGLAARPILGKSGLITPMAVADGYIRIDRNREGLRQGTAVAVYPLS